jgi:putative endonuclease
MWASGGLACRLAGLPALGRMVDLPAGRQVRWPANKTIMTVYAIKSISKNYIYVGMSNEISRRFKEHCSSKSRTTRPYAPFKIIYTEECPDRKSARVREKYLKSGVGKEFLRSIV